MSRRGGALLQEDVPWRASPSVKPIPKIHHSPVLRLPQTPYSNYALSVMKHPNPIQSQLGNEALVESAGPDCIVPGQMTPIRLLGLKLDYCSAVMLATMVVLVWPIYIDLTFMEPVGRQLETFGKIVDSAFDIMEKSFADR